MDKLNDKVVIFDVEEYKKSIRKELEENVRYDIEFDVYYGLFRGMPVNMLCEQFIRLYKGSDFDFRSIDEKGFCLMYAIVMKTCEYLRDCKIDLMSEFD